MQAAILIVKHGALGDVVRTSYFCKSLYEKYHGTVLIHWLTAPMSEEILSDNPYINFLTTDVEQLKRFNYEIIYSLDDENEIVSAVCQLEYEKIVGAYISNGEIKYTTDTAIWFDMGLLSNFGKAQADHLKKENTLGHAEMFRSIFDVNSVTPNLYIDYTGIKKMAASFDGAQIKIGINPYAGGRWPSKELLDKELILLINELLVGYAEKNVLICLFGAHKDRVRNEKICEEINNEKVQVIVTDDSIKLLALSISEMDFMISSDSLAMHLAISQRVPIVAFFAPTSAVEIDDFGFVSKVISTSDDYCSYKPNADNSTITAKRILETATPRIDEILRVRNRSEFL
ncbi:hypothetical protein LQR31_18310 [Chromobacterium vaccinii]|uniref:glycosyltransferase family 9 protein n=1 Tax=Chromobacterium vaccinii TaxID=1108595 RepID=UPI001E636769|nr:glycosyltransferase family 9 protein [Chromobacterium vaccinii]MCD4486432.1 hypothetical protein [Chromobacterium vaccinii]